MKNSQNNFSFNTFNFEAYVEACDEILYDILNIIPIDGCFFRYSTRIKEYESIKEKIIRKKYDINNLQDIVGIRFVFGDYSCVEESFDLYILESILSNSDYNNIYDVRKYVLDCFCKEKKNVSNDLTFVFLATLKRYFGKRIIEVKDYINNPKDSGYESLHVVIVASNGCRVEIQARNLCQHIWSFLQHKGVYKGSCNGYKEIFFQQFAGEIRNYEKKYSKNFYNPFY